MAGCSSWVTRRRDRGHKGDVKIQGGAESDPLDGRGGKDKVDGGDGIDTCADRPRDRLRNCEFKES